jgi:hypothetical protein
VDVRPCLLDSWSGHRQGSEHAALYFPDGNGSLDDAMGGATWTVGDEDMKYLRLRLRLRLAWMLFRLGSWRNALEALAMRDLPARKRC